MIDLDLLDFGDRQLEQQSAQYSPLAQKAAESASQRQQISPDMAQLLEVMRQEREAAELKRKMNSYLQWEHDLRQGLRQMARGGFVNPFAPGGVITLGELPQGYVDAHGSMTVRTPQGNTVPLSEAYSRWGGTHVNPADVPGLTDWLLRQDQPDIATRHEVLDEQRRREAMRNQELIDRLYGGAAMGAAGKVLHNAITGEGAVGHAVDDAWNAVADGVNSAKSATGSAYQSAKAAKRGIQERVYDWLEVNGMGRPADVADFQRRYMFPTRTLFDSYLELARMAANRQYEKQREQAYNETMAGMGYRVFPKYSREVADYFGISTEFPALFGGGGFGGAGGGGEWGDGIEQPDTVPSEAINPVTDVIMPLVTNLPSSSFADGGLLAPVNVLGDGSTANSFYVDFPAHQVSLTNGTGIPALEWVAKKIGIDKVPLGHSGVLFMDPLGHTEYYEYGRYDNNTPGLIGVPADGNYRKVTVPDKRADETYDDYLKRLAETFPDESSIRLTRYEGADIEKGKQRILNDAKDPKRRPYSVLSKNCKNVAKRAAIDGLLLGVPDGMYFYKR